MALACASYLPCVHAGPVSSAGGLTDLGLFAAGRYTLTGSGPVDICGGGSAVLRPDGLPDTTVTCAPLVSDFNPNGSYTADGLFGRSGLNARIGALIGTFNANAYTGNNPLPDQADEWFLIGNLMTLTLVTEGHIERTPPLSAEVSDNDRLDLHRLVMRFDVRRGARFRELVRELNALDSAPPLDSGDYPAPGTSGSLSS